MLEDNHASFFKYDIWLNIKHLFIHIAEGVLIPYYWVSLVPKPLETDTWA